MQFTVNKNPGGNGYLLDLQANVNSHFTTRVVAPLLPIEDVPHYASSLKMSVGQQIINNQYLATLAK